MDAVTQVEMVKMACAVSTGDAHALVTFWRKISLDYAEARVNDVIKAYEEGNHGLLLMIAEHAENTHLADIRKRIALGYLEQLIRKGNGMTPTPKAEIMAEVWDDLIMFRVASADALQTLIREADTYGNFLMSSKQSGIHRLYVSPLYSVKEVATYFAGAHVIVMR